MQPLPSPQESPLPYAIMVVGLAFVLILLFIVVRRRLQPAGRNVVPASRAPAEATMVFQVERSPGKRPATSQVLQVPDDGGAYMIPLLDEAGTPGTPIPIREQSLYIGRDGSRAQIVFTDSSVSRLHARLVEESDGVYMLHDEGSASGTFVNDERVDLTPRQLNSGDLIEFGRQKVVFHAPEAIRSD